mmetsp:Transcript_41735/g.163769  ORF Transcript_41735/g.163769 Transcript_41735/m.163769 type:complete len:312 (-) Transcript_41735:593-1528(-)
MTERVLTKGNSTLKTRSALWTARDFGRISPKNRKNRVRPAVTYATAALPPKIADATSVATAVVKIVATVVAISIVVRNRVKLFSRTVNIDESPSSEASFRTFHGHNVVIAVSAAARAAAAINIRLNKSTVLVFSASPAPPLVAVTVARPRAPARALALAPAGNMAKRPRRNKPTSPTSAARNRRLRDGEISTLTSGSSSLFNMHRSSGLISIDLTRPNLHTVLCEFDEIWREAVLLLSRLRNITLGLLITNKRFLPLPDVEVVPTAFIADSLKFGTEPGGFYTHLPRRGLQGLCYLHVNLQRKPLGRHLLL